MSRKRGVYVLGYKRTPFGKFLGAFRRISATELAGIAINGLLENARSADMDGVILGNVYSAGLGGAPARQASLGAGLPYSCPASLVREECASSLLTAKNAMREIQVGEAELMIAGGMENMSNVPLLAFRSKKEESSGPCLDELSSHYFGETALDSMYHDGLLDPFSRRTMGELADLCAEVHKIPRESQEAYSHGSFQRACEAQRSGKFDKQIIEVGAVSEDEGIREPDIVKMRLLSPSFSENGIHTPATSAQISDGAAVLLLGDSRTARKNGLPKLARMVDVVQYVHEPDGYAMAPVGAIKEILHRNRLDAADIDFFEINEAFAVVPIYAMRKLGIPHEKLNIWGGAISLGHPLGASGARIVMNLTQQLNESDGRYGIACACHGGGGAMAVLIENTLS